MTPRDLIGFILLAAIWGASFLFLHLAVPEFGAFPTAFLRMSIASLFLLPLLIRHNSFAASRGHWRHLALVGLANFAIPFSLWSFAMHNLPAGVASILNATTPLWGGLVAWAWLKDRPSRPQISGLLLGFLGVAVLSAGKSSFAAIGSASAIAAALLATLAYGFSANYTKRHLSGVPSLVVAGGSQLCAVAFLLPLAWSQWPSTTPTTTAWICAIVLGVVCTSIANVLYFRLLARSGPARAMSITFMIPAFGMLWGALFLAENITLLMLAGCAVILIGTALASGAWKQWRY